MWDCCGQLGMPVAIHVADPSVFFTPIDRFNERCKELSNHPDWSFYGRDFPSVKELLEARNRVFARHPKTCVLVVLHVGNCAENLASVSENLDQFPNVSVDIAARIGELGRQPRTARKFFDQFQDRILLGTDATPHGEEVPQQMFGDQTRRDLLFAYSRRTTTTLITLRPQFLRRDDGASTVSTPEVILRKVYFENAARQTWA